MDALGVGERARRRAVFTDELVMMDAIDGGEVARIPVGRGVQAPLRQSVRGHPSRRHPPVDLRGGAARLRHPHPHVGAHRRGRRRRPRRAPRRRRTAASTKARRSSAAMACIRSSASASSAMATACRGTSSTAALVPQRRACRRTCAGMPRRSGSDRTATSSTTRCAAASSTTSSSPFTAGSRRNGACGKDRATRSCRTSPRSASARGSSSTSRPRGSAGRPPIAIRSSAGAKAGRRSWATPRIRCCNIWRRARASRSRTR